MADGQRNDLSCLEDVVLFGFSLVLRHPGIIHNILQWSTTDSQWKNAPLPESSPLIAKVLLFFADIAIVLL